MLHRTIQKVTKDTEGLAFNTAISTMMEFVNHVTRLEVRPRSVLEPFVLLLAPYAPHIAEELWRALGHSDTLAYEPWPKFDPALAKADEIEVPVQVNGKLKARLKVPAEIDDQALEAAALADETVKAPDRREDRQDGEGRAAEAGECGGGVNSIKAATASVNAMRTFD